MNKHDSAMRDFYQIFGAMHRQGPGSEASLLKGLSGLPENADVRRILEVGCGAGASALALTKSTSARIVALDNYPPFIHKLKNKADRASLGGRLYPIVGSMTDLPFSEGCFDLIWSEGAAYNMGFEEALSQWKRLLRPGGWLFVSEAVWTTSDPSPECRDYWNAEYPAIRDMTMRLDQAQALGYRVLDSFILPRADWEAFYGDMAAQLGAVTHPSRAHADLRAEIDIFLKYGDEFSYLCLMLQNG